MKSVSQEHPTRIPDSDYPDPGGILAAGMTVVANKYPIPNLEGLPPDEAEVVFAQWRKAVREFYRELDAGQRELALRK